MKDFVGKDLSALCQKKLFLLDMDGTIYMENSVFPKVKELLSLITCKGGKYVFVTNNSSKSVSDYIVKLTNMGIKCDESNFFTSTQASSFLLKNKFGNGLIYVQATKSCTEELRKSLNITEEYDESVKAILVGFDTEVTGEKIRTTSKMLTKTNALYYATNPDWVCPVEFGYIPDCGSYCFALEKATGRKPTFIGKPNPLMIELAIEKFGAKKDEAVVIGDRIYTDIASGYNAKVDTVLVLSGESTVKDYKESQVKPTFLINNIGEIYDTFNEKE